MAAIKQLAFTVLKFNDWRFVVKACNFHYITHSVSVETPWCSHNNLVQRIHFQVLR